MSVDSEKSKSNSKTSNFTYGLVLYLVLGASSLGMILFTEAEISLTYVLIGALAGSVYIIIHHFLSSHSLFQRAYEIVVFLSIIVLVTQDVTGKLAMVVGVCIATIVVSYWLDTGTDNMK
ncbi:hypothetical protein SAMN04488556_1293 [Halostagnicola kamekurae]|uniref:Uncharacterized protein n=1 Tax=Halostagnicola kamekurae TaxID=619731 RepID=A0A1I6QIB1_9EURY|nr:hypothetical protein SAMN04488556_1293 [Halostagnicola kamekurae]